MIKIYSDKFALLQSFTIARGTRHEVTVLRVEIARDGVIGRGECVPYAHYGETLQSVADQIRQLDRGINRHNLQNALPAGAARNAVDCALWDLEAKKTGRAVWQLAGLHSPQEQITAYTLSLTSPEQMALQARANAMRPLLKIKLGGGDLDLERIRAVRANAPNVRIIVDANEGWDAELYARLAVIFLQLGIEMIEQPLPADADDALLHMRRIVPVCADESCHDRESLPKLHGKYDMINIKLDKAGGLSEALALRAAAIKEGYQIMVGCMLGSSLGIAPAILVAQGVAIVDLDAPLLLAEDRLHPIHYGTTGVCPAVRHLWG